MRIYSDASTVYGEVKVKDEVKNGRRSTTKEIEIRNAYKILSGIPERNIQVKT
jgi:hypothetical protein